MDSSFHVIKSVPLTLTFLDTTHRFIKAERFKLKYSLKTSCPEGTPNKDVELYQNTSYRIINEFLDNHIHTGVVYSQKEFNLLGKWVADFDNNFIVLPAVSESVLLPALHAKLNTISHEYSSIDYISLDNGVGLTYEFVSEETEIAQLPDINDWLGDLSFWKTAWWYRRDFSAFDNIAHDQEEYDAWTVNEDQQDQIKAMAEVINIIESEVYKEFYPEEEKKEESGKLIEIDFEKKKFKPKLVPKDK